MARTTAELVGGIIKVDASISVTPFIDTANDLVTELCAPLGYSATRLELIERWLAAHFYAVRDRLARHEYAGGVGAGDYGGEVGMYLESTTYGQQALMLDTKGGLSAEKGKASRPSVTWLGTEYTGENV